MKTHTETLVRPCYECKGSATGRRENYNYLECGLKNIVLRDVMVHRCSRCGAAHVEIGNMEGLHRTIALSILCKSSLLAGDEIKFLRTLAGFTATNLAKSLGVTKQAVSRWENGAKRVGMQSDRSIRITCGLSILQVIVNDPAAPVAAEEVRRVMEDLKVFLAAFNARDLSLIKNEVRDSEKIVIDPDMPYGSSFLSAQSTEPLTVIQ